MRVWRRRSGSSDPCFLRTSSRLARNRPQSCDVGGACLVALHGRRSAVHSLAGEQLALDRHRLSVQEAAYKGERATQRRTGASERRFADTRGGTERPFRPNGAPDRTASGGLLTEIAEFRPTYHRPPRPGRRQRCQPSPAPLHAPLRRPCLYRSLPQARRSRRLSRSRTAPRPPAARTQAAKINMNKYDLPK